MESIETELCDDPAKTDSRGRRIYPVEERERLVKEYQASGLTQKAFCRRESISLHTFVTWWSKHLERNGNKGGQRKKAAFREVHLPDLPRKAAVLEVQLASGEVVRGSEPVQLAKLVGLLRG